MQPIRATPSSDELSERTGGTPVRIGQRNCGSAPPHCESCPPHAGLGRVGALARETPPVVPVPGSGHCRTLHRPAHAARREDQGTGQETLPQAGVPPGCAAPPRFDSQRWHWLRSPRLPTAWPARHRLSVAPSRICRDPRGWDPSARPFFCRLLGAIEQHLIPVDPLQDFITMGQLAPSGPKGI